MSTRPATHLRYNNALLQKFRSCRVAVKPKTSEKHPKMEAANRIVSAAIRAVNNNTVISVCLVGSFVALGVRSVNQQKNIEALEAEKDSLITSNKAMKKAMWDWKQQLLAEADTHEALVPLSRLKAIYGEAPIARNDAVHDNVNSPAADSKLVI